MANSATSVFGLIRKFEQLSQELTRPTSSNSGRRQQPSEETTPKEQPQQQQQQQQQQRAPIVRQATWTSSNPLVEIEERIGVLKRKALDLQPQQDANQGDNGEPPADDKALLEFFIEMMDLLIKLSGIDTDGLKAMKAKKEYCLNELKALKVLGEQHVSLPDEDSKSLSVAEANSVQKSIANEATMLTTSDDSVEEQEQEEHEEEYSGRVDVTTPIEYSFRTGSVQSLAKMFEAQKIQGNQTVDDRRMSAQVKEPGVEQDDVARNAEREENVIYLSASDNESDSEVELRTNSTSRTVTLDDVMRELQSIADMLDNTEHDDIRQLQMIEESLEQVVNGGGGAYAAVQQQVQPLLERLHAIRSIATSSEDNYNSIVTHDDHTSTPLIEIEEVDDDDEDHGDDDYNDHNEQEEEEEVAGGIQVIEVNIPTDNDEECDSRLVASSEALDHYKTQIRRYLAMPTSVILEREDEIQRHRDEVVAHVPHDRMVEYHTQICDGYKELLDLITEAKFSQTFREACTADDDDDDDDANDDVTVANGGVSDSDVKLFDALASVERFSIEAEKYCELVAQADSRDAVRAAVLRENMLEVQDELENIGVVGDADADAKRIAALRLMDDLLEALAKKQAQ